ncbi:site-specific recombination directionality factor RDF [Mycobacterium phage Benedict]|uniref:Uncharacterized protein n=1 Tax=Mycobacterium phage Benedict TaxID=2902890 RepID=G1EDM1_9CAUD|nr:site-specific recombination directionality factor RDF [Mycobacterium phage Benedict]AEJ93443.1 hypothetical protein BENEDICT_74 [Mycobacterium phage Benedict]
MRLLLTLVVLVLATILLSLPGVIVEASAAPCIPRSETHVTKHGGLKADSAWHVANGELPTCDSRSHRSDTEKSSSEDTHDDERKSRFCRKRWWC